MTVQQVAEDWLTHGLDGRSAATIRKNRDVLTAVLAIIGRKRLRELTAADVHAALASAATDRGTATVAVAHSCLTESSLRARADRRQECAHEPAGHRLVKPTALRRWLIGVRVVAATAAASHPPQQHEVAGQLQSV
jgi:hypothetical protein